MLCNVCKKIESSLSFVRMEYMCHLSVRRTFIISLVLSHSLKFPVQNVYCVYLFGFGCVSRFFGWLVEARFAQYSHQCRYDSMTTTTTTTTHTMSLFRLHFIADTK